VRRPPFTALAALWTCLCLLLAAAAAGWPAAAADVHGDDERDVYVGTGGLLLPGSVDEATRRRVASCPGCQWRLASVCTDPGLGPGFDGQGACTSIVRGCPQGRRILRAWFRPAGEPWRALDVVCLSRPVTVVEVGLRVADRVEEAVPAQQPSARPAQGVVTQVPVRFAVGQPTGPRRWSMQILGRVVAVTAVPEWSWSFGDETGDAAWSTDAEVEHAYRRAGLRQVEVRTRWTATYVVDGLGPFSVDEQLLQSATFAVAVGQGRAVLVPG